MLETSSGISRVHSIQASSKLTESVLKDLYSLVRGNRFAQTNFLNALEAFHGDDYRKCQDILQSIFERVEGSLRKTAQEDPEGRTRKILEKRAADARKSYKKIATPSEIAKTEAKAKLNIEKAQKIITAFELVLGKIASMASAQVKEKGEVVPLGQASEDTLATSDAASTTNADSKVPHAMDVNQRQQRSPVSVDVVNAFRKARSVEEARLILAKYFLLKEVRDAALIQPGALYHLYGGVRGNFVRIANHAMDDRVHLEKPDSADPIKTVVPVRYFLATGKEGKTHLLLPRADESASWKQSDEEADTETTDQSAQGRQNTAITRATFQMLASHINRAKNELVRFSALHKIAVTLNIDASAITDIDRGAFRRGQMVKARRQASVVQSQLSGAVSSARSQVHACESSFTQRKEKVPGSLRRKMEASFGPACRSLDAVDKSLRNLIRGLDTAVNIIKNELGEESSKKS